MIQTQPLTLNKAMTLHLKSDGSVGMVKIIDNSWPSLGETIAEKDSHVKFY